MAARCFSVGICSLLACLIYGQSGKHALTPDQVLAKARKSVFIISADTPAGRQSATGFLIDQKGLAVAPYSLIESTLSATAKFSDGSTYKIAGVVDYNKLYDLALVKVNVANRTPLTTSAFSPNARAKVYTVGSSNGSAITLYTNSVKQVINGSAVKEVWIGGPTSTYNLGAPVVNTRGEVIGAIAYYHTTPQRPDLAVSISYLKNLNRTLALKPFGRDVVTSTSKPTHPAPPTESESDTSDVLNADMSDEDWENAKDLVNGIVDATDGAYGVYEQYVINLQPGGLSYGVDPSLYVSENLLKSEREHLQNITFENYQFEQARHAVLSRMDKIIDDADTMVSLVTAAQLAGSWSDHALHVADLHQKEALSIGGDEDILTVIKNKYFQKLFPKYYLELMGVVPLSSGYKIGILSMVNDPLSVVWADPDGVAGKLKINSLDRILSIDGVEPKDMDDFKRMVKESAGRKVIIRVAPKFGDEREFQVEVPADLGGQ